MRAGHLGQLGEAVVGLAGIVVAVAGDEQLGRDLPEPVEDAAITLRRTRRLKLPDAIVAATARVHGLELLTLDDVLAAYDGGA